MSGTGEGKIHLGKADVYLHPKGKSGATVTHLDIELAKLNEVIKPGESSFVGGKKGGVFIGLKKNMIQRIFNSLSSKLSRNREKFPVKKAEKKFKK